MDLLPCPGVGAEGSPAVRGRKAALPSSQGMKELTSGGDPASVRWGEVTANSSYSSAEPASDEGKKFK